MCVVVGALELLLMQSRNPRFSPPARVLVQEEEEDTARIHPWEYVHPPFCSYFGTGLCASMHRNQRSLEPFGDGFSLNRRIKLPNNKYNELEQ